MKNVMMAVLLLLGTIGFSQEHKERGMKREAKPEMTAEQKNDLRLKQLTLKLDLTASQQKEMKNIIADQQKRHDEARLKRQEYHDKKTKPTADEIYAMQSKRLDYQIEQRAKLKKLLNADQFAKWDKMNVKRKSHFRRDSAQRSKRGGRPHKRGPEPQ